MSDKKNNDSQTLGLADSKPAPEYKRDLWFYIMMCLSTAFILVFVITFFTVPAFNASYHSFDANGNSIIVSLDYSMLEIMTEARQIIEILEMVTFEAEEARSGLQTFAAWMVTLASLFCIILIIRFIYMLFANIVRCSDAGKFAFSMIIVLMILMVAVAYFLNPTAFGGATRVLGVGNFLSEAYQFSFSMFPLLIVQYIMLVGAIVVRFVLFRKFEVGIKLYFNQLKDHSDIRTVKSWECAKCNKTNYYYNIMCTECGARRATSM